MHIRDGLVDAKHYKAMGDAIWLYLYLHKSCAQKTGLVKCYRHQEAADALGLSLRTTKNYMNRLRDGGYVTTTRGHDHLAVQLSRYEWQEGRRDHQPDPQREVHDDAPQPSREVQETTLPSPTEVQLPALHDGTEEGEKCTDTYREVQETLARTDSPLLQRGRTTANAVGADAPPAAQNHTPSPPSDKPATTSAPYVIAGALLTAQNRVPTQALCRQKLKAVCEHVTDAYREHPQKPGTADALACIAYLLTDPYIEGDVGRLTPQLLGSQLGPWLKAGKPARWVDPKTRRGKAPPSQASPPSGVDPRLVALDPRLERWAAARKEERDRYHEAHKHELGGP